MIRKTKSFRNLNKSKIFSTSLKEKARLIPVTIHIGKSGLTEFVIDEIKTQLKKKKLIKIKFLSSLMKKEDKKKLFNELAEKTDSEVISCVGFVIVLYKPSD